MNSFGSLSMKCMEVPVNIIAIIDLRKHPEKHGMGRAMFGLITGVIGSALLLAGMLMSLLR